MHWYLTKIVYRIICGDGAHTAQFDEQLRLIQANSQPQALAKAKNIGTSEAITFVNNKQQLVQWKFVNVSEAYLLHDLVDGTEIYSRIEEKDNALVYESIIHAKARYLQNENNPSPLLHV